MCVVVLILPPASNRRSLWRARCDDDTSTSLLMWTEHWWIWLCQWPNYGFFFCLFVFLPFVLGPIESGSQKFAGLLLLTSCAWPLSSVSSTRVCTSLLPTPFNPLCVYLNSFFGFLRLRWRSMREGWRFCAWCEVTQTLLLLAQSGCIICMLSRACLTWVLRDTEN